jgi:hypothetical protein
LPDTATVIDNLGRLLHAQGGVNSGSSLPGEVIAEAYDWGAEEVGEFTDLIGVEIDQLPTWGQQQEAIGSAIQERRRVDDLVGVLLAMHAVRIEPTLADEDWNEGGASLVAFLTSQGY